MIKDKYLKESRARYLRIKDIQPNLAIEFLTYGEALVVDAVLTILKEDQPKRYAEKFKDLHLRASAHWKKIERKM